MAAGSATFVALADGTRYYAAAQVGGVWRYVSATTDPGIPDEHLVGDPTAPTAAAADADTSLANTAFVAQEIATHAARSLQTFEKTGALTVAAGTKRLVFPVAVTILGVTAAVGTAPVGAALIVDVNKNGTTIFSTQGNRPTVADGANASLQKVPDVSAFAAGDYLTVDVDQVGSGTAGSDLVLTIRYK